MILSSSRLYQVSQTGKEKKNKINPSPHPSSIYFSPEAPIQIKKGTWGASLVEQWLRIRLPMQGTRVRALVREDPTCRGATEPVLHNY